MISVRFLQQSEAAPSRSREWSVTYGIVGTLRSNDAEDNENVKKNNRFNKQNNNFARASHFFVHFFPVFARLRAVKMPYFAFIEDVNKQQRNFISLSEFGSVVI